MTMFGRVLLALILLSTLSTFTAAALAQTAITTSDVQRLQDNVADVSRDVAQLRSRNSTLAAQLQSDLDMASDEAIYLKVKLRKNEPVSRSDYLEVLDRVDSVRSRARGETSGRSTAAPSSGSDNAPVSRRAADPNEVPVGTELDVRLSQPLSSGTSQVEDRFEATTMVDLKQGDRVLVPAGSVMRGVVSSVNKAGRVERKGSMTVAFDRVTVNGRDYPIRATVTDAIQSDGIKAEAGKIGAGAGVGAIIGGVLGGFKGAMAGILIGGGGTIAATEGKDVELPPGTVLRVRLDAPMNLQR